jgi:hypothetical protein
MHPVSKIKSFGCSFLDGSDLENPNLTWPARIAKTLGMPHENYAEGGSGNLRILNQILLYATVDDFCFVNWTYTDRFCYRNWQDEKYKTLMPAGKDELSLTYYKHLYGQYHSTFISLMAIKTAVDFFRQNKIPFIITYMDHNLTAPVDLNWCHPFPTTWLQNLITPFLYTWRGRNFLEWARINDFQISEHNHPLDQAHEQAANFFGGHVEWILNNLDYFPFLTTTKSHAIPEEWAIWQPTKFDTPIGYK